jgi:tetratricopeptide (TPR) repeat protein
MATQDKYRVWLTLSIAIFSLLLVANLALAKMLTFEKEYTYQASEIDSKVSCRAIALEQVKRLLLEELGTYVESNTEVKDFQLTKDQITTLTAGSVETKIIEENWDGKVYRLKAKITADPNEVAKSIDALRKDRQRSKDLEETRKRAREALKEIEKLKNEIEIVKMDKGKQEEYKNATDKLNANDWFDRGIRFFGLADFQETINAFSKVIELDPKIAEAYFFRGSAHGLLGSVSRAISDYDMAIKLNPKLAPAYSMRGVGYGLLGIYQQAVKDCDTAIELDPTLAISYFNRGSLNVGLGKYQQAIRDFNRTIELDPKFAAAYSGIGAAHRLLGDYRETIKYSDLAMELDPKDQLSYYNKAVIYERLGNYQLAIENYKIAARLGYKHAQDYLRSNWIQW